MLRPFFYLLLFSSSVTCAQRKITPVYTAAMNWGFEELVSKDRGITVSNRRAQSFYISAGLQTVVDSLYIIYAGLRYGRETSNFEIERNGVTLPESYYFSNQTLTLLFAPGLVISKRQRLFLVGGIARFYQSNVSGSGTKWGRPYVYGLNQSLNSFDPRLGLKWQVKPFKTKKLLFEAGTEASFIQHRGKIEIQNTFNTLPNASYAVRYNVLLFYFGLQF